MARAKGRLGVKSERVCEDFTRGRRTIASLLKAADQALYCAETLGRDRVELSTGVASLGRWSLSVLFLLRSCALTEGDGRY